MRDLKQCRGRYAIDALLVLLNLLEGYADGGSERLLAHPKRRTPHPHLRAYIFVDFDGGTRLGIDMHKPYRGYACPIVKGLYLGYRSLRERGTYAP